MKIALCVMGLFLLSCMPVSAAVEYVDGSIVLNGDISIDRDDSLIITTSSTIDLNGFNIFIEGELEVGSGTRFVGTGQEIITFSSSQTVLASVSFENVRAIITSASSTLDRVRFSGYETALIVYNGRHAISRADFSGGETALVYKPRTVHQVMSRTQRILSWLGVHAVRAATPFGNHLVISDSVFGHHSSCVVINATAVDIDVFSAIWADGVPLSEGNVPPCVTGGVVIHNTHCPSVIFIPGMQASRLYMREENGSEKQLWEPSYIGDAEYLALTDDGESIHSVIPGEPVDELRFFGGLYTDPVYGTLLSQLEIYAEHCGGGFIPFGYDWRLPIDHPGTMAALDGEIGELRADHPDREVVLIAHSMGGLIAKQFIQTHQDTAGNISAALFIGTPHLGTPKSYASILHGDGFDIAGGIILTEAASRRIARMSAAALALLPSKKFFDVASTTIMNTDDKSVLSDFHDVKAFLTHLREGYEAGLDTSIPATLPVYIFERAEELHHDLDGMDFPSHVRIGSIIGTGLPTLRGIQYRNKTEQRCVSYGGACITTTSLEHLPLFQSRGDGTVLTASARHVPGEQYLIGLWDRLGDEDQKISHYNMTESPEIRECVSDFLDGRICSLVQTDTSQSLVTIGVHSPLVPLGVHAEMFGGASYVSYLLDGMNYESTWRGTGHGSAEISVSIEGSRHYFIPAPFFVATSTVMRISITSEGGLEIPQAELSVSYDFEGDGINEAHYVYIVLEDSIKLAPPDGATAPNTICSYLEPWHWHECLTDLFMYRFRRDY